MRTDPGVIGPQIGRVVAKAITVIVGFAGFMVLMAFVTTRISRQLFPCRQVAGLSLLAMAVVFYAIAGLIRVALRLRIRAKDSTPSERYPGAHNR